MMTKLRTPFLLDGLILLLQILFPSPDGSMAIVGGMAVAAGVGALGNYYSAKKANKPRTQQTDQTSTTTPYAPAAPHLDRVLAEQENLYNQGVPDYGSLRRFRARGSGPKGQEAMDLYRQVAEQGLAAGDSPMQGFAANRMSDIWSGGETGFEGYNPILADLAGRYGGLDLGLPTGLLMNFLGENNRNQVSGVGGPGGGGGAGGGGFTGSFTGGGGGGMPPDLGRGGGTFATEIRKMFDEEGNEEEIAGVLESMRGDIERESAAAMRGLEERAMGSGRFGGSWHSARLADSARATSEKIAQITAQLRYGDLEQRRNARLQALSLLNNREIAAMGDATSRAGINASSANAAAGRALQEKLGLRAQDLEAIMGIGGLSQFGLGQLANIGGQLSSDRMGALGLAPAMEGLRLGGLDSALGAGAGMSGLSEIDAAASAQNAATERQNALMQMEGPQRLLNDYLRTVMGIGQGFGTTTTQGTNVIPGAGISPIGAGLQGGLGGALAGYGIAGQLGAGGG